MNKLEDADEAVIVALGSNVKGEYLSLEALLEAALERFESEGLAVVARSGWWRSAAWPDPADPDYRNGVAVVETRLSPKEVHAALARIETRFGRRPGRRNAPRTLDLDLIAYGRSIVREADLTVPHPRAHERLFVMGPLAELLPRWSHPVSGVSAEELAARARVGADATPA